MKKLPATIILLLACCAPCHAGEAENLRIAQAMTDAINSRELDRLDQLVSPGVVRHSAATPGVRVASLAEFKAYLQSDFSAVPDSEMTIDVIFANEEYVAMRAIYAGTQSGRMGPFPPSGKRMELPFLGILRFEGGKVAEMWVEWDNLHALTQLGHFDPPSMQQEGGDPSAD